MYGMFVVGKFISFVFLLFITPLFSSSPVIAELTGFFMMTLPFLFYFILCERSRWQGTWGKKKMGIRVVDSEGQRIGTRRCGYSHNDQVSPLELLTSVYGD